MRLLWVTSMFLVACSHGENKGELGIMLKCWRLPGQLRQVEASQGGVYGIGLDNLAAKLVGKCWSPLDGDMKHITAGLTGVWATDLKNHFYTLEEDTWRKVPGTLEQVDAGGTGFLTGVKKCHLAFCAEVVPGSLDLSWTLIPGKMQYYSCGPLACWGGELGIMLKCWRLPGRLRQVEASQGGVYGIGLDNLAAKLVGKCWSPLDGDMKHITAGPTGVWATDLKNHFYTLEEDTWRKVPGTLEQVDAGGTGFLTGVKKCHLAFCAEVVPGSLDLSWTLIPGKMQYYSCGPLACWGVGEAGEVYVRTGVHAGDCVGQTGTVDSKVHMAKVEVSSDGSVFALSSTGVPYERIGISDSRPQGTGWVRLRGVEPIRSLSYDRYTLWLVNYAGAIRRCIKVSIEK
ncbi:hypothetical protein SKAU_G00289740 [Synaphobranchus kaupii]|uniref:Fish-egg lectin-like n=1 Tax=Synaphobranchus kaupii TaxID=118154 RepID=A0A9Q1ETG9_SYNKA|nr:hypothetical protein SKAU_G00289740 [Synaphobranchus kaupii]